MNSMTKSVSGKRWLEALDSFQIGASDHCADDFVRIKDSSIPILIRLHRLRSLRKWSVELCVFQGRK
jgi:hypothetical protein